MTPVGLATTLRAGLLGVFLCSACGSDVALDCSPVAMSCQSGRYRVDGAGCILECLAATIQGPTPPVCPAGPPLSCPYGVELDAQSCLRGCTEPKPPMVAGLCLPDGEPLSCSSPAGQPARECMNDALVCGPEMRCVPRVKTVCDPRMPMCPPGLACRLADGCRPPFERCLGGYVVDPLGCVRGCRPPPMPPAMAECPEPVPPCPNNLYQLDLHGCIAGCRPPPTIMPPPICGNLGERCTTNDGPVCRGCAFGYTLDEHHCLDTMCLPDPGVHPCAPPPGRCDKGFSADSLGCLSCRK